MEQFDWLRRLLYNLLFKWGKPDATLGEISAYDWYQFALTVASWLGLFFFLTTLVHHLAVFRQNEKKRQYIPGTYHYWLSGGLEWLLDRIRAKSHVFLVLTVICWFFKLLTTGLR